MKLVRYLFSRLSEDLLLLTLLLGLVILLLWMPEQLPQLPTLVEWHTIAILTGLMVLSRGLEDSGALTRAGHWLLEHMHTERQLALAMVVFAALLSAIVTNDVALFIVVPLTLSLGRALTLPTGRLIIFEALAVNAGSAVSPIGNPQNLYLWQLSGDSFVTFFILMLPIAGWMLMVVLLLTTLSFSSRKITVNTDLAKAPLSQSLLLISLLGYPLFLIWVELGQMAWALVAVLGLFLLFWRNVLLGVDWLILLIFVLMFVVLGLLAQLPVMAGLTQTLMALPGEELTAGVLLSQVISNVPAAIFLSAFSEDWYRLAWGVNVGGFGLAIGSMANLIALRLGKQPGLWWQFHLWSLPTLLFSLLGAYLFLPWLG
ncbi:SLC13 family permease [Alkalimonas delamerensis]|uniref:SLC13 family permease n=1 Tax=Alkalimonas delamerensis TaxID=265981 RepID=A0ABT9GT44_9GAMM|nr:SLC13 family permease [Alkalimonas delamerensis]MDP4530138.1 SLC13 family permease [Alkalimonas delamerensis]